MPYRRMGWRMRPTWALGIGAAVIAAYSGLHAMFVNGELGDKAGWAALQGLDTVHDCGATTVRSVGRGKILAIGFPAAGAAEGGALGDHCRSWVLLNEHASDREVKQMPRYPTYKLDCKEVAELPRVAPGADAYVLDYLRSICTS